MSSSMTGFGRASLSTPFGKLVVEIQSVNRKYADVFVTIPKELSRFEPEVRKAVADFALRGQITLKIYFTPETQNLDSLLPNPETLRHLKQAWEKIAVSAGLKAEPIDLPFLMLYFPFQQKGDWVDDSVFKFLKEALDTALKELKEMRLKEGKVLFSDLESRLELLEKMNLQVEELAPQAAKKMGEKLRKTMEEFLPKGEGTEEKLFREAALFAEKIDVTEEITRLKSHFGQFRGILNLKNVPVGRKMDFLVQEMGREINTIGSKSLEAKISYLVVEMKSELEKMREQIQNIE